MIHVNLNTIIIVCSSKQPQFSTVMKIFPIRHLWDGVQHIFIRLLYRYRLRQQCNNRIRKEERERAISGIGTLQIERWPQPLRPGGERDALAAGVVKLQGCQQVDAGLHYPHCQHIQNLTSFYHSYHAFFYTLSFI